MNRQALLIFPPQVTACYLQIYPSLPTLASSLKSGGCRVKQLDLNNAFIEWYLGSDILRREVSGALKRAEVLDKKRSLNDAEYAQYVRTESLRELMAMLRRNRRARQGFAPRLLALTGGVMPEPITNADLMDMVRGRTRAKRNICDFYDVYFKSWSAAKPFFVGISVAMLPQVVPAMLLTRLLKRRLWRDVKVFLGGPIMSLLGDETLGVILEHGKADGVIVGEGEEAAVSIAAQLMSGSICEELVPNLIYKKGSGLVRSGSKPVKHIREYPSPHYDGRELRRCSQSMISVLLSRNCSWGRCAFCEYPMLYRRKQLNEPEEVVGHLKRLVSRYPQHPVWLSCDMVEPTYMRDMCRAIIREGLEFRWMGYLRADDRYSLSDLRLMKRAGCFRVSVGVESLDTEVLRRINKGYTADQAIDFLHKLLRSGIEAQINMIVDLPGTTYDSALKQYGVIEGLVEKGARRGVGYSVMATPLLVSKSSPMGICPDKYGIELDVVGDSEIDSYINCLPYHDDHGMNDEDLIDVLGRYRDLNSYLGMMRLQKGGVSGGIGPSSVFESQRRWVLMQDHSFDPERRDGRHERKSPPYIRIFNVRNGLNMTVAESDVVRWIFKKLPMNLKGLRRAFAKEWGSVREKGEDELLSLLDRLFSIGVISIG